MGISLRHHVFAEDGSFKRVPLRVAEALLLGVDAIPEYAGTKQKVAKVLIENKRGKPARILDVTGVFWDFDDAGKIDESHHRAMLEWMDLTASQTRPKRSGIVVDLVPEIRKKKFTRSIAGCRRRKISIESLRIFGPVCMAPHQRPPRSRAGRRVSRRSHGKRRTHSSRSSGSWGDPASDRNAERARAERPGI